MRVLRLLAMPLLALIWVAPAVAQSGAAQSSVAQSAPSPQNHSPLATPNPPSWQTLPGSRPFSLNPWPFTPKPGGPGFNQTIPPLSLRRYNQFPSGQDPSILLLQAAQRMQRTVIVAHNDVCYTIREYTFARDNPGSDATTMKDYSACRPANNFHLKGAVPASPR
jgi:hypothetical protein